MNKKTMMRPAGYQTPWEKIRPYKALRRQGNEWKATECPPVGGPVDARSKESSLLLPREKDIITIEEYI